MKLIGIPALLMLAALAAGCEDISFDRDYSKIISFADLNFRERITPYFDSNGDGYISINEAQNGRMIPYDKELRVVMDCDNGDGGNPTLFGIDEVRYFTNVQVLLFRGNNISGTLDLKMLKSLIKIDFTGNADIEKIILNSSVKEDITIETDADTEIEYYTDPEE